MINIRHKYCDLTFAESLDKWHWNQDSHLSASSSNMWCLAHVGLRCHQQSTIQPTYSSCQLSRNQDYSPDLRTLDFIWNLCQLVPTCAAIMNKWIRVSAASVITWTTNNLKRWQKVKLVIAGKISHISKIIWQAWGKQIYVLDKQTLALGEWSEIWHCQYLKRRFSCEDLCIIIVPFSPFGG